MLTCNSFSGCARSRLTSLQNTSQFNCKSTALAAAVAASLDEELAAAAVSVDEELAAAAEFMDLRC